MPCVNHPFAAEVALCAQCGKALCADCVVTLEGRQLCGPCKNQVVRMVERGQSLDTLQRVPSPWEEKASAGNLFLTARQALLSPTEFFGKLRLDGKGYWSYLILLGWPSAILGAFLGHVTGIGGTSELGAAGAGIIIGIVLLTPLQLLLGVAITGAITHLFLRIFGAANAKLETTIRTVVYAYSVLIFNWIPILGPIVGGIWAIVLQIIGLKQMHNTTYGRVIAALFIPAAVVIGIIVAGMVAAFVAKSAA